MHTGVRAAGNVSAKNALIQELFPPAGYVTSSAFAQRRKWLTMELVFAVWSAYSITARTMTRTIVLTIPVLVASPIAALAGLPLVLCQCFCLVYGVTFQPRVALNCARAAMTGQRGRDADVKGQIQYVVKCHSYSPEVWGSQHSTGWLLRKIK